MSIVISLFLLRYIALFVLCIVKSGRFVYLFKPILFLNQLAIPLMVLALAYVYLRWDKLNFSINYVIAAFLSVAYIFSMFFIKGKIVFNSNYGYLISIKEETIFYLVSLVLVGSLLVFCVYFVDKPNNNKWGMIYLIIALVFVIIENILYLGGIRLFPYPILGDGIFIFIMNLAVNTFKKRF
ncbi:hypothetical protein [Clostridium paraputrificum]|uniref:hypothetical protein n=1 Tax=Clostridium paraputrificum TaxID=29363 RepID=UPI003D33B311